MFKGKLLISIFLLPFLALSQANYVSNNIFQTDYFIENRGQFDYQQEGNRKILYSTEMPFGNVFFHKNGFSINQKKSKPKNIHEQPEYNFAIAEMMEKTIHLEWLGTNPNYELIKEQKSNHYFSFGPEEYKSYGYKKLTYKNIYPNIDIVYTIEDNSRFHYSILLHKGAKVSDLKMRYNNVDANLLEGQASLELLGAVFPVYEYGLRCYKLNQTKDTLPCIYNLANNQLGFNIQGVTYVDEEMEIDPWVANVTTLTGESPVAQKGYDVDYDSDGNLIVFGGGYAEPRNVIFHNKIAKYSMNGVLLWTFNCNMPSLDWNSANYLSISNIIVDKNTDKIYTGEGYNNVFGSRIIRLKTTGIYDSFISSSNPQYQECWEFQFNCSSGDIIVMGGGTNSNLNLGVIDKQTGIVAVKNITGIPTEFQDILSSSLDNNAKLYVILVSSLSASSFVNNRLYKVNDSFNNHIWSQLSGYNSFSEAKNKIYTNTASNGYNALSANSNYLFYYDGVNLKAFNLNTGNPIGNPFLLPGYSLIRQGGIESDDCNNVYIGGNNGNALVFKFDGTNFTLTRQIYFNGHGGKVVLDLKASKKNNKLYASGDGFVAESNFSLCDSALLGYTVVSNCLNSARVTISNGVGGSTFDFVWTDTSTNTILKSKLKTSQLSDTFTGIAGKIYKLSITRNSICLPSQIVRYVSFKPDTFIHKETITRCQGQSYTIGKRTYTNPGIYKDTIIQDSCPRIVQTTLNFLSASFDSVIRSICFGDTIYIKGEKISQSGIYFDSLINRFGCDSIMRYDVQVLPNSNNSTILFDTICFGESRVFNSQTLTTGGSYKAKYTNVFGCDSTVTLFLTVITPLQIVRNIAICNGDTFKIDTYKYTKSGKYNISYKSGKNCDSTVEINLKVSPTYFFTNQQSICYPKSVNFYGQSYNKSGLYYKKFQTINGCDSIYELDLRIFRITGIENYEFCKGDSLKILNRYVKTSGDYYDTFKLPSGCDSFHLTKVNVRTWPVQQIDTVLCADDSFIYKNMVYKQAAIISDTIFSNYKTSCHKLKFIYLDFKNCDTLNECNRILIPTGFTPNNDGINDKLSLIVKSEKINIVDFVLYNRWGHLVYNYFDEKVGWNGLYKGDDAPVGVYNYSLKYKCKGQNYTKSGNVTLLR